MQTPIVYYIVDAQPTTYQITFAAAEMENPHIEVNVVPLTSREAEEVFAQQLVDRALLGDASVQIVDLRGR